MATYHKYKFQIQIQTNFYFLYVLQENKDNYLLILDDIFMFVAFEHCISKSVSTSLFVGTLKKLIWRMWRSSSLERLNVNW